MTVGSLHKNVRKLRWTKNHNEKKPICAYLFINGQPWLEPGGVIYLQGIFLQIPHSLQARMVGHWVPSK